MTELSAADIRAVTDGNHYGYGYGDMGNSWIWVILLFALFGGGYGGYNRNGYGVELQQGFDNQSVMRKLDGITNGLCDGFYAVNTNNLQMQNQLARDLCQGFSAVNSAIAENRFAAQNCCCETNRNIDAVRYENAKNTCEIVRAIEKDGEATRALMNTNTMEALKGKIAEQSQMLQSASIVNSLRPCPIPAYITCSPYQTFTNGYGCNGFFA